MTSLYNHIGYRTRAEQEAKLRSRITLANPLESTMAKKQRFMDVPGSDPSATMKGDIPQHVKGSTAPSTPPNRPKPIKRSGQFNLRKERK